MPVHNTLFLLFSPNRNFQGVYLFIARVASAPFSLRSLPLKVRRAWFLPNKHFYFLKRSGTQRFAHRTAGHRAGSQYLVPLSPDRPESGTAWLVVVGTSGTETHPATSRPELSNGRAVKLVCRGLAGRPAGSEYRPSGPPASRHALTNIVWHATLSHCAEIRNDTPSVPTRALVDIRVDTPRPPFPDKRGQSRTPTKHRIIRTTIRRHSRDETSPNSRLCRRVVERRRRVGSVSYISDTFRAPLATSLSFVRALSVSSSSSIPASPGSFRQGARTLGRVAARTRSPWATPSPHSGTTSAGRYPPAVASYLGAIIPGAESAAAWAGGPERLPSILLPFCPPDLRARTHASNTLHLGGLRRFFPAAANIHAVHFSRYFPTGTILHVSDPLREFYPSIRAIFLF